MAIAFPDTESSSLKKIQQYLQVFNLLFKIDFCILHKVIKKHRKGGKN